MVSLPPVGTPFTSLGALSPGAAPRAGPRPRAVRPRSPRQRCAVPPPVAVPGLRDTPCARQGAFLQGRPGARHLLALLGRRLLLPPPHMCEPCSCPRVWEFSTCCRRGPALAPSGGSASSCALDRPLQVRSLCPGRRLSLGALLLPWSPGRSAERRSRGSCSVCALGSGAYARTLRVGRGRGRSLGPGHPVLQQTRALRCRRCPPSIDASAPSASPRAGRAAPATPQRSLCPCGWAAGPGVQCPLPRQGRLQRCTRGGSGRAGGCVPTPRTSKR